MSIFVNVARQRRCVIPPGITNSLRILAICCLIASVHISGCSSALLQRSEDPPTKDKIERKSDLVKPRIAEPSESGNSVSTNGRLKMPAGEKPSSQQTSENAPTEAAKRNPPGQINAERPKSDETKSEKSETSDPARRITAKAETSTAASDADDSVEAKSKELFKRHDHTKYLEIIKNKAVDLVNSDQGSTYAAICKDMITDQWSLAFYYTQEKTYKYVTYAWDEIDEKWQKSFESGKRPISGLEKHLKYSSSGKDCKVLKKTMR